VAAAAARIFPTLAELVALVVAEMGAVGQGQERVPPVLQTQAVAVVVERRAVLLALLAALASSF